MGKRNKWYRRWIEAYIALRSYCKYALEMTAGRTDGGTGPHYSSSVKDAVDPGREVSRTSRSIMVMGFAAFP